MAIGDEKAEVDRTSNSVKEQDNEITMAGYLPRSDEDYNVTLKTWLVVTVSCSQLQIQQVLILSTDLISIVRNQLLDRTIALSLWSSRRNSARKPYRSFLVHLNLYHHRDHSLYGLRRKFRLVRSAVVYRWRQCHHVHRIYRRGIRKEQHCYVHRNVAYWLCEFSATPRCFPCANSDQGAGNAQVHSSKSVSEMFRLTCQACRIRPTRTATE
jgi:hypothetical protein